MPSAALASSGCLLVLVSNAVRVFAGRLDRRVRRRGVHQIEATQVGNGEYVAAPPVRQTVIVAPAAAVPPSLRPHHRHTVTLDLADAHTNAYLIPTGRSAPLRTPALNSDFSLLGNPKVNIRTGAIRFHGVGCGSGDVQLAVDLSELAVWCFLRATSAECRTDQVGLGSRCLRRGSCLGVAARSRRTRAPSASRSSRAPEREDSLAQAFERGRGLPVTATLMFRSSLGATPSPIRGRSWICSSGAASGVGVEVTVRRRRTRAQSGRRPGTSGPCSSPSSSPCC